MHGRTGNNRSTLGQAQIAAQTDIDALKAWRARFLDTRTTFDSYRKESERLLLWATLELGKPLSSLTHEDLLVYQRFLGNPQPADRWVMKAGRKWSRFEPDWRPFAGPLAPISQRQAIIILNTMFSWLVNAGYLAGNPLSLSRQRQRKVKPRITRFLDESLWSEVKSTIETMPREMDREREHYFRVRWLFSLFFLCGLRISEVILNTMGGFFVRRDAGGEERWWLEITGKGDKTRLVPATAELMVELARYRRENGLSPYPLPGESTPLLLRIGGKQRAMTRSAVHLIVKEVFNRTASRIRDRGVEFERLAHMVEDASAHWMRHGAFFTGYKRGQHSQLITAFQGALAVAGAETKRSAVLCRGRGLAEEVRGDVAPAGQGTVKVFAAAAVLRDHKKDFRNAFQRVAIGVAALLEKPPHGLVSYVTQPGTLSAKFPGARALRREIWAFTRDPKVGLPSASLLADSQWHPLFVIKIKILLDKLQTEFGLTPAANIGLKLKKTGLPNASLLSAKDLADDEAAPLRVDTVRQAKGESLDAVLYMTLKDHAEELLAGVGTEVGRIGYVASTRARDLLWVAVPNNALKDLRPLFEAKGFQEVG